ncbi:antibiotic biosynthesis monooxygenase [Streptomyces sp. NPDC048309]|uniref:putative quinol monooxygenase n=2 Tax=unclassified Streptomyces TaxID=2593676 RepID=UPI0034087DA4
MLPGGACGLALLLLLAVALQRLDAAGGAGGAAFGGAPPSYEEFRMIFIVVRFPIRPQYRDQWLDRVADFTAAISAEAGNLFFERSVDAADLYRLV